MDVFYFSSPAEPTSQDGERDLKWKDKPSAKRRKVSSVMDSSAYHARAVRVAEPTAVANDLSSLPLQYLDALLDAGYIPSSLSSPPEVPADQTSSNSTPKPEERSTSSVRLATGHASEHPTVRAQRRARTTANHPRPESSDIWEEEDGRRICFAFPDENDDHVERLRLSYNPTGETHTQDGLLPPEELAHLRNDENRPQFLTSSTVPPLDLILPPHLFTTALGERSALPVPPPPPPLLPHYSASQMLWDDNLLPVDDHHRSYDFADFMDDWRCRSGSSRDVELPAFKPAEGPSPWRRPHHDYIRHDASGQGGDIQGLRWEAFDVSRSSALTARGMLHPQRRSSSAQRVTESDRSDGLHYKPRAFAPNHRARFGHYQLRNMTAATSGRDIFYADGSKVNKASLSCPSSKRTVMDLAKPSHSASPFKVTCLAPSNASNRQGENVLIAGGFNGEYAILDLDTSVSSKPSEGIVSHAKDGIVNHINTFLDRQSGLPRAAFSSNDHRVRIMDLRRQRFVSTFGYDSAINCSAMSPDGRLRALVHDGADSWVTNAETGETLVKLDAHTDFAFACAWSACGRYVATGAEDQQVVIWDARNWSRPLRKLDCVMSCARSLHFADDDTLVIAESEDVISVVDTATFDLRQDLRFFGSIAGISLLDGGAEMVIANADETVGGLMSFQAVGNGCGVGFGQRSKDERNWSRPRRREYRNSIVEEVVV